MGDETEVLYLIAPTEADKEKWKDAFLKGESTLTFMLRLTTTMPKNSVAAEKGNIDGSTTTWCPECSCYNETRKEALRCQSVTTITRKVSQTSVKSDVTLKNDSDSTASPIRRSSSCSSGFSNCSESS